MNVAILTQDDGVFSAEFVKPFIREIINSSDHTLTSVNLSRSAAAGKKENLFNKLKRVQNSFGFNFVIFNMFLFLKNIIFNNSVNNSSKKVGVNCFNLTEGVNSDSFRSRLQHEGVDVVVVIAGTEIIKADTLRVPPFGFVNCHSSLLPSDKGLMPVFWSLLNNRCGFTWYKLDVGIDTGKILFQQEIPVEKSFVAQLIITKQIAASALLKALNINIGDSKAVLIQKQEPSYNKFPKKDDVIKLKAKIKLV